MEFITFFEEQIKAYNEENYCGKCWEFSAPLTEEKANAQQMREDGKCCVQVMVTRMRDSTNIEYRTNMGFGHESDRSNSTTMDVYFLMPSTMGTNNYNETKGYGTTGSNWEEIIKPLWECVNPDMFTKQCELLGYYFEVTQFSRDTVTDFLDENWCGIKLNLTIRI